LTENAEDLAKLKQINTLFTGEFDTILFQNSAPPTVIDHEMGLVMQAKPVTELDRLVYVFTQIQQNFALPKGAIKYTPALKFEANEAFSGLSKEDCFKFENWQFPRKPQGAKK